MIGDNNNSNNEYNMYINNTNNITTTNNNNDDNNPHHHSHKYNNNNNNNNNNANSNNTNNNNDNNNNMRCKHEVSTMRDTGVHEKNTPLGRALALQHSNRNCYPAPDLVCSLSNIPRVFFSGGVFVR